MSTKRSREALDSANSSSNLSVGVTATEDIAVLADEIRAAREDATASIEKRTAYIKSHLDNMNETQQTRFEFFMRSHLSKKQVKELMTGCISNKNITITDEMAIAASGLSKLLVGEIMDISSEIAKAKRRKGVTVEEINEAYRCMRRDNKLGGPDENTFLFAQDDTNCFRIEDDSIC